MDKQVGPKELEQARKGLSSLKKQDLVDMGKNTKAPEALKNLMTAVSLILKQKGDWPSVQTFFVKQDVLKLLQDFHMNKIDNDILERISPILENPNFSEKSVSSVSKSAAVIYKWLNVVYNYGKILYAPVEADSKRSPHSEKEEKQQEPEEEEGNEEEGNNNEEEEEPNDGVETTQRAKKQEESLASQLQTIREHDLSEIIATSRPQIVVIRIMEAMCLILGEPEHDWAAATRLLKNHTSLMKRLTGMQIKDIPKRRIAAVKPYTIKPELAPKAVGKVNKTVGIFASWLRSVVEEWEKIHGELPEKKIVKEFDETERFMSYTSKLQNAKGLRGSMENLHSNKTDYTFQLEQKTKIMGDLKEIEIFEFKRLHATQKVIEGLMVVLEGQYSNWSSVNKLLSNYEAVMEKIKSVDVFQIPMERIEKLREIIQDPELDRHAILPFSTPIRKLLEWLDAIIDWRIHEESEKNEVQIPKPTLIFCNTAHINELRTFQNPTSKIKKVFEAVLAILGEKGDWTNARKLMANSVKFLDTLTKLNIEKIPGANIEKALKILEDPETEAGKVKLVNQAAGDLAQWARGVVDYWVMKMGLAKRQKQVEEQKSNEKSERKPRDDDSKGAFYITELTAPIHSTSYQVSERDLNQIKELQDPSYRVIRVIEGICTLLGEDPSWENGLKILSNTDDLLERVYKLRIEDIPEERVEEVKGVIQDPQLSYDDVLQDSPAAANLLNWLSSFVSQERQKTTPKDDYDMSDNQGKVKRTKALYEYELKYRQALEEVKQLTRDDVLELNGFKNSSGHISKIMDLVSSLLGRNTGWEEAQELINSEDFLTQIINLGVDDLTKEKIEKAVLVEDADTKAKNVENINKTAAVLAKWSRAIVKLWKAKQAVRESYNLKPFN